MKTDSKEASYNASYEAPLTRKIGLATQLVQVLHSTKQGPPVWEKLNCLMTFFLKFLLGPFDVVEV